MRSVPGGKEESRTHRGQVVGCRTHGAWADILDRDGSPGRAITLPELIAVRDIIGREVHRTIDIGQVRRNGASGTRSNVLDHDGSAGRAITLPELKAM